MIANTIIDKNFAPFCLIYDEFKKDAEKYGGQPFAICIERNGGLRHTYKMQVLKGKENFDRNLIITERVLKCLLWIYGGYKVILGGDVELAQKLKDIYSEKGKRSFDFFFMSKIYLQPFEIKITEYDQVPESNEVAMALENAQKGNRIGLDIGGSFLKSSAIIDGEVISNHETPWQPKVNSNPKYHYDYLKKVILTEIQALKSVDSLGISSAGVLIENQVRVASIFMSVDEKDFKNHAQNIFINLSKDLNIKRLQVANDGDVAALTGARYLKKGKILAISMGTSEAGGYIDNNFSLAGWLNELAFVPIDLYEGAAIDEWSGDIGCGVKYLSQDGMIKLAEMTDIDLTDFKTPTDKLTYLQELLEQKDARVYNILKDMGVYLAYALKTYSEFYDIDSVILSGGVTSGERGEVIINSCKQALKTQFPELKIDVFIPDGNLRRIGSSITAAFL